MVESIFVRQIYNDVKTIFADGFQAPDLISLTGVIMDVLQHKPQMKGQGALKKEIAVLVFEMAFRLGSPF